MKKVTILLLCIIASVAVISCKKEGKKAGEYAKEYAKHIHDGNYDKFVEHIVYIDEIEPATATGHTHRKAIEDKDINAKNLKDKVDPYIQSRGGLKNLNYIAETITKDGKEATVTLQNEYNDGSVENVICDMIFVEDVWKIKVGHNKEVWRTTLADGTPVSVTLKETEHKEVFKDHVGDEREFEKIKDTDDKYVEKEKADGHKDVLKLKDKEDEIVIKEKHDGEKEVTKIEKK